MTQSEEKVIEKGYGLKDDYDNQTQANHRKNQFHANGFKAQVFPRTENGNKRFYVYVKK